LTPSSEGPKHGGTVRPRLLLCLTFVLFTTAFLSIIVIVIADRGRADLLWEIAGTVPCGGKLGHLGLVGTLCFLLNLMLHGRPAPGLWGGMMLGSLLVLVFMTLEEASQAFIPHRSFDLLDSLANIVGVFCGEGLARMLPLRRPQPPLGN
jgi:hypothetical protein